MKNKLTVPWTSRLTAGRLFHWPRKVGRANEAEPRMLKEDDLDHLGALHSAHHKKR